MNLLGFSGAISVSDEAAFGHLVLQNSLHLKGREERNTWFSTIATWMARPLRLEGVHGTSLMTPCQGGVATDILATRPFPSNEVEHVPMLQLEDIVTIALSDAGVAALAALSELAIVLTDNQAWQAYAHAITAKDH
jgi:hypothetical protein